MSDKSPINALLLSKSDNGGGAAIAANRINAAVIQSGVNSQMWVDNKRTDDSSISSHSGKLTGKIAKIRPALNSVPRFLTRSPATQYESFNWVPSAWPSRVNASDCDVVHLHWYNSEMLSISDIAKISKPKVQTLHDMWSFCGSEHLATDSRWQTGYDLPVSGGLLDIDLQKWTWKRKLKHWLTPHQLVAPSQWMADCVKASYLFNSWPVCVIGNPIDTDFWKPLDKYACREHLGIGKNKKIVLFGAIGGTRSLNKGFDLLLEALSIMPKQELEKIVLVIFGQSRSGIDMGGLQIETFFTGHLQDQLSLRLVYNAADLLVSSSRIESFGQTTAEAHACGVPVVAFDDTGCADIVSHKKTGYLAKHCDVEDLAAGISWTLYRKSGDLQSELSAMARAARENIVSRFGYDIVGKKYAEIYSKVIQSSGTQ